MATTGVRYNVADLRKDVAIGIKIPFLTKAGVLFDQSYSTEDQLLTNLKNLILTQPGERIMQPQFGTYLREALFEPNDATLRSRLDSNIRFAIGYWLPYVTITSLDIEGVIVTGASKYEEHGARIVLTVRVTNKFSELPITFLVTPSTVTIIETNI